ncbi:HAD-IB family hydrolase [Actinoplanes sp. NPDC049596]|uniref:HAD family hydrolase n=1 Tax=unclassified Actinoplanes TaxID=2626549 RepID=UPI003446AC26
MRATEKRIAFFDVDGTLTTSSTMFHFLRFYLREIGRPDGEYAERRRAVRTTAERGTAREEVNRAFFAGLAGFEVAAVEEAAQRWYHAAQRVGGFYHQPVLDRLRGHQRRGDRVVLVSGAVPACLRVLAEALGVDEIHSTELEIERGRYTGALIRPPMIGIAKLLAVLDVMARCGTASSACYAYGDHISDLPMLQAVGSPAVVRGDAALEAAGRAGGWRLLLPPIATKENA